MFYNERLQGGSGNTRLKITEFRYEDIVFKTTAPANYINRLALYAWIVRTSQRLDQYIRGLPHDSVVPAGGRTDSWRQA